MFETVVLGVISNAISEFASDKVREVRSRLSDYPEVMDDIDTKFEKNLRAEIDSQLPEGVATDIALEPVFKRDHLAEESSLWKESGDIVDDVVNAILETAVPPDQRSNELEQSLRRSVEDALNKTSQNFLLEVHEAGLAPKLGLEVDMEILRTVNAISDSIDRTQRSNNENKHFVVHNCHDDGFRSSQLRSINRPGTSPPEYVERSQLEDVIGVDNILIVGRKGSGKTESLLRIISKIVETKDTDYIVEFQDSFVEEDISDLLAKHLQGNILFVCDDIHRLHSTNGNHPLRLVISRMRTELEESSSLDVAFTIRSERFSSSSNILHNPDHIWDGFKKVSLRSLKSDEVRLIVESLCDHFEEDVSEYLIDRLVSKIVSTDSTPHYTVSAVKRLVDQGGVNDARIEKLPSDAEGIWAQQYRSLVDQSPEAKRALISIKLLRDHLIPPTLATVKDIYENVLEGDPLNYQEALVQLLRSQWIELGEPESDVEGFLLIIHDAQLDGIEHIPPSVINDFRQYILNWNGESFNLDSQSASRIQIRVVQAVRSEPNPDFSQIEPHLERAIELAPESVFVRNMCGVAYSEFGHLQKGRNHFEKALELEPDNPSVNYNFARFLSSRHEVEKSLEHYRAAADEWPDNPVILHGLAMALVGSGKLEDGLNKYEDAISEGGSFGELHFGKGDTLNLLGRYEAAKAELACAIQMFRENEQWLRLAKAHLVLSIAQFNTNDLDESWNTAEAGLSIISDIEVGEKAVNPVVDDQLEVGSVKNELLIISSRSLVNQGLQ
ncbi:tetratricopeptide repeat protein [Halorientalis marina]|uniref:tetratricopeptide repeat protein n=1 Tax=Halorientalis marina TaxID=2931976 RepID=UPI001FF3298A|nr:tetratricopeptide repeat protein [Halorientalis marina]